MKILGFLSIILISVFSFLANAETGTGSSTGGGSFVVIDGDVMIADPFFAGVPARRLPSITEMGLSQFPDDLNNYSHQTNQLFRALGIDIHLAYEYLIVPPGREENVPCDRYVPLLTRNVDEHTQYGCTFRNDIYLFSAVFNRASVQQQYLALMHERMWKLTPAPSQEQISTFVTALQNILPDYVAQRHASINHTPLPRPDNIDQKIQALYHAARDVGITNHPIARGTAELTITPHGGFVDASCRNALRNSAVGIGSTVRNCQEGTSIDNSQIFLSVLNRVSAKNSYITNSKISFTNIEEAVLLQIHFIEAPSDNLMTQISDRPSIVRHGKISYSMLFGILNIQGTADNPFDLGSFQVLTTVIGSLSVGPGVKLDGVTIGGGNGVYALNQVSIGANTAMTGVMISYERENDRCTEPIFSLQIGENTRLSNGRFEVSDCGRIDIRPGHMNLDRTHLYPSLQIGPREGGFTEDMQGNVIEYIGQGWPVYRGRQ